MCWSRGDEEKARVDMAMVSRVVIIPQKTLADHYVRAKEKLDAERNIDLVAFDRKKMNAEGEGKAKALTSEDTRLYLQEVAKARDESNRGMPRKEMIQLISNIQSCPIKTASNHYEWLVRTKKLPELNRGGRVVTAQPTITNCTTITTKSSCELIPL